MNFDRITEWFDDKGVLLLVLALALAATGYWGYQNYLAQDQLQTELNNRYEYSFQEFNDHLDRLQEELGTMVVSNEADNLSVNLSNVWQSAYAAHEDVGQLPLNSDALDNVKQLLVRTVRYASYLDRKVVDRELKPKEKQMLKRFHQQVKTTSKELETVHNKMRKNNFKWHNKKRVEIDRDSKEYSASPLAGLGQLDGKINLEKLDERLREVAPKEIEWDAPNVLAGLSRTNRKAVNEKEAIRVARKFIEKPEQYNYTTIDNDQVKLREGRKVKTKLPTHSVKAVNKENESEKIYIDVSKKGGRVVWLLNRRQVGDKKITLNKAIEEGKRFLRGNGYKNMVAASSKAFNDLFIVSFAPLKKGAIIKPKRVLLEIALDNGEVTGFNGVNNILHDSSLASNELTPKLNAKKAKSKISDRLELEKEPRLILDRIRGQEKLCYEFVGNIKGEDGTYKIKINAKNGKEEEVKSISDDIYQQTE